MPKPRSEAAKVAPMESRVASPTKKTHGVPTTSAKPKRTTALAKPAGGKVTKANVAALDEAERLVAELLSDGMASQWRIGAAFNDLYSRGLFKYRVDEAGKPLHTFASWCDSQNISVAYARALMGVAANYTEEEVRDVGASKLNVNLRLPREQRHSPGQVAKLTARQLEAEVRQVKGKPARPPKNEVTAAIVTNQPIAIPMATAGGERCRNVTPQFGEHRIAPDLLLRLAIRYDDAGEAVTDVEFVRTDVETTAEVVA